MIGQKDLVRKFFDGNRFWQGEVYAKTDRFSEAVSRRKFYAFDMIDTLPEIQKGVALDIGCGSGVYMPELLKRGFEVFGMDVSEKMLENCKRHLIEQGSASHYSLSFGDVESIPYQDQKFDLILCVGVLGYLLSDEKGLDEIYRVLKPGGCILIGVSNLWNISDADFWFRKRISHFFTKHETEEISELKEGYAVTSQWILKTAPVPYQYRLHNLSRFERKLLERRFHKIDALTFGFPLRSIRRIKIIPESAIKTVEIAMERFFRRYKIPWFFYSGEAYLGFFRKIPFASVIVKLTCFQSDLLEFVSA